MLTRKNNDHRLEACRQRFCHPTEAQIVIESWRRHYNTIRPHSSIGCKPPAPEVFVPAFAAWPAARAIVRLFFLRIMGNVSALPPIGALLVSGGGRYLLTSSFLAKPFLCVPLRADRAKCDNCCSEGDAGGHNRRKLRRRFPKSSIPKKLNCHEFSTSSLWHMKPRSGRGER